MWRKKAECWSSSVFRCAAAAALALLMAQDAPSARAQSGGGAGAGTVTITVTMSEAGVFGGDSDNGTITLSQPAPTGGATVQLGFGSSLIPGPCRPFALSTSSVPASMPGCVNIAAATTSATFTVSTINVNTSKQVKIIAQLGGSSVSGNTSFYVNPVTVYFSQKPTGTMNWGSSATWGVTLNPVPTNGATIVLSSSNGSVTVPTSVNVPGGTFTATAATVSPCLMSPPSPASGKITASWEGATANAPVTVGQSSGQPSRYTNHTIRIDPSTIVGISHDGLVLILNKSQCASMLAPGSVMFVKGLGVLDVRKLAKIPKSPAAPQGGFAVAVKSASLTDFINEGKMQVFFQNLGAVSEPSGPNGPFDEAAEPYSGQAPGESPWKYSTTGTANNYSFVAYKENNGLKGSVSAKGDVTNGSYDFLAVIHGDKLQEAKFTAATDGTLDVEWMAQTTASGQGIGESRLRMHPLFSGLADGPDGVPFLFQIYANLIFKPGFGEKAAAKGHFKITYKGEAGIDGSSPVNEGLDVPPPDISSTTSSAKAAHGAVVAVNAPKFAISFGTESFLWAAGKRLPAALSMKAADFADSFESQLAAHLSQNVKYPQPKDYFKQPRAAYVMWVSSVAYAGAGLMGAGLISPVPCQQYYLHFLAQAGIDKKMLGSISGSIPPKKGVDVFKKDGVIAIPSIKGCYPQK